MNKLTALELKILNGISQRLNPTVKLGTKIDEIIDCVGATGTPVNAVSATATLAVTGISLHGETITINNPAVAGVDVYEFLADEAQVKSAPDNIPIDITDVTVKASGTLTVDTRPTAGDTLTIGTKTYIFVPVGTANSAGEISIGADLAGAQAAIVAAINGTDGVNAPHPKVTAAAFAANASVITALIGGTAGNAIATTETFTAATNIFAAATLGSGTNCTAVNTAIAIIAAILAHDTQGVTASAGSGNDVVLSADVAGVIGNAIVASKTMANATVTTFTGGVDGTVATGMKIMVDATYMYVCLTGNTKAEKNWRRVSLGSAY